MKVSRIFNVLMALFLIAAAMANVQPAAAQNNKQPSQDITSDTLFVPGEVVVGFAGGQSVKAYSAQASALAGQVNAQVVELSGSNALLSFAEDADVSALAAQLSGSAGVKYAEPNYITRIPESGLATASGSGQTSTVAHGSNAMSKAALSAMRSTHLGQAAGTPTYPLEDVGLDDWGWLETNASIIWPNVAVSPMVCVVDSGVDGLNPDLVGKVTAGKDFVNDDLIPNDDNGHGTHVAGIIAGSNSNKKGIIGVSNGMILAVKVLNAQGWGTAWDLAQGIRSCADNATLKVINLSLTIGTVAPVEIYDALEYAIINKGKFVVAAAGNESVSTPTYPGAWSVNTICRNGTFAVPCADTVTFPTATTFVLTTTDPARNTIYRGMVAVAAGRAPGLDLWVDINGDAIQDANEFRPLNKCLTNFSNYGSWIEIMAPGDGIFSTLPISYPFNDQQDSNIYDANLPGYGWMSGTSQAAPFVSGAVSRLLSVFTTTTNRTTPAIPYTTKTRLLESGVNMSDYAASDSLTTDPTKGYNGGSNGFQGDAPFCLPNASAPFGAAQDMSATVYLDTAAAMARTAVTVQVRDALSGLPLTGATVQAYQGAVLKDTATVSSMQTGWVDLINLPISPWPASPFSGNTIENIIKVNKTGYATAAIIGTIIPTMHYDTNEYLTVSVPPTGKITLVTDWGYNAIDPTNLDLFTYLPLSTGLNVVGNPNVDGVLFNPSGGSIFAGNLGLPATSNYRTRWNRDGGTSLFGNDNTESVSMNTATVATFPAWNEATSNDTYNFFVTDYGFGGNSMQDFTGPIVVRVWRAGVPISGTLPAVTQPPFAYSTSDYGTTSVTQCDSDGVDNKKASDTLVLADNNDNEFLKLGHITKDVFTFDLSCGVGAVPGILPYSFFSGLAH